MNEKTKERIRECREKRLKSLNLESFGLTEIPAEVGEMNWLEILVISNNENLSDFQVLKKLSNLKELYVWKTQIDDLQFLETLPNLQLLDIADTPCNNIASLDKLVSLRKLDISNTQVTDLSPLLPLIQKGIPVEWQKSTIVTSTGSDVFVVGGKNSPLTNPPQEIIEQGNEAILRYFEEKERLGAKSIIKVREAKLLIVGQGGAGKTTLRDKLLNAEAELPPPDATTRGIEIRCLDEKMPGSGEPFKLNIWDFGGQNIQHYAHQFFLTGSALYTLVSSEREQNENFQYWLNIIEMLGGASPVIIVQNKKAGHFEEIRNAAAIRERFENVLNRFFALDLKDAATEQEFKDLRKEILFKASQLPHVEREYLASFAAVREKLEAAAATGKHFLKWDEYLAVGAEVGIEDNEDLLKDYAKAFTFLGVCQYFPDDLQLRNFVFLNPKWIIDALFQLLYHKKVEKQHGVFEEKDTLEIWKGAEYRGMEGHLVRMMENFELCYRITGDSHRYIVPQRLPAEKQSYNWDEPDATPLLYEYKFMPKGIVTRLTCRLHTRIEGDHVWNDAVIFSQPDGKARVFVREVYGENKIELRAAGEKREGLFNEVIRQIDDIHATSKFANLQVDKKVPCPCPECAANPATRHFYKYELLEKAIDKGKTKVECGKTTDDVSISEIFGKSGVKRPDVHGRFGRIKDDSKRLLEELIALGDTDKALQTMQEHFPGQSEVIAQLSRLSSLEEKNRTGQVALEEYARLKSQIVDGVLKTLERL